jgi:serine/threonine protein kinase
MIPFPEYSKKYGSVEEKIGSGKFANVYKTTKGYAVKKTLIDINGIERTTIVEIAILSLLKGSPGIINILDWTFYKYNIYLSLPLAEGTIDILDWKSVNVRKDTIRQILIGLAYCHSKCIIHRDIKEDNILVVNGSVKIADFGLSLFDCPNDEYKSCAVQATWYKAPEVLSCRKYDYKIDVWSVGIILAGKVGFNIYGNSGIEQLNLIVNMIGLPDWPVDVVVKDPIYFGPTNLPKEFLKARLIKSKPIKIDPVETSFLKKLLAYPDKRYTALEALKDPFIGENNLNISEPCLEANEWVFPKITNLDLDQVLDWMEKILVKLIAFPKIICSAFAYFYCYIASEKKKIKDFYQIGLACVSIAFKVYDMITETELYLKNSILFGYPVTLAEITEAERDVATILNFNFIKTLPVDYLTVEENAPKIISFYKKYTKCVGLTQLEIANKAQGIIVKKSNLLESADKFCKNNIYYDFLKSLDPNVQDILKSLAKEASAKGSDIKKIQKANVISSILNNEPKTTRFFFNVFDQPFGNVNENNVISFTKNTEKLSKACNQISLENINNYEYYAKKILGNNHSTCAALTWFFTYDLETIKTFHEPTEIETSLKFGFLNKIVDPSKLNDFDPENRPVLYNNIDIMPKYLEKISINNFDCINNAKAGKIKYIYNTCNFVIENIPSVKDSKLFSMKDNKIMHRNIIVIKFLSSTNVELYYLESAMKDNLKWVKLEQCILDSVKFNLQDKYNLNVKIITFEMDSCPRFDIQEDGPTCNLWSFFLYFIYMLNSNRKIIFETLKQMTIKERNKLLLYFLYFVNDNDLKISVDKTDQERAKYLQENSF